MIIRFLFDIIELEREVREFDASDEDGGYFNMKGDDAYAHKYQNLEERSSKLSAYEIVQTIIGINLLIVTIVGVCISTLKNDNKK